MQSDMKSIETPITEEELKGLESLFEMATPGEWIYTPRCQTVDGGEGGGVLVCQASDNDTNDYHNNGSLIAAMHGNLPRLIAEVRRLREHDRILREWVAHRNANAPCVVMDLTPPAATQET